MVVRWLNDMQIATVWFSSSNFPDSPTFAVCDSQLSLPMTIAGPFQWNTVKCHQLHPSKPNSKLICLKFTMARLVTELYVKSQFQNIFELNKFWTLVIHIPAQHDIHCTTASESTLDQKLWQSNTCGISNNRLHFFY